MTNFIKKRGQIPETDWLSDENLPKMDLLIKKLYKEEDVPKDATITKVATLLSRTMTLNDVHFGILVSATLFFQKNSFLLFFLLFRVKKMRSLGNL